MQDKNFILIDGHALAYRYFFALERTGMKTSDNQPTWAVFGFFKALFDLLQNRAFYLWRRICHDLHDGALLCRPKEVDFPR